MAFMKLDVQYFTAYHVDTEYGTEVVPAAACGTLWEDARRYTGRFNADGSQVTQETILAEFCEGSRIEGVEKKTGFYARLSAPGYLDCTEWDGPHTTREAALLSVREP